MSSFFKAPKAEKKRKRVTKSEPPKKRIATAKSGGTAASAAAPRRGKPSRASRRKERDDDEEISGSEDDSDAVSSVASDDDDDDDDEIDSASESGEEHETAAEKRLRLAQRYLDNLKQDVQDDYGFDAAEIDKDIIATRLREDVAESKGKVFKQLADNLAFDRATHALFKSNTNTVTAVATQGQYAYIATKDLMLQKWRLQDLPKYQHGQGRKAVESKKKNQKLKKPLPPPRKQPERVKIYRGNRQKAKDKMYKGHTKDILAVAASQDGKFVVTGGADHKIIVYEAETLKPLRVFTQHRSGVTGLAFRRGTNQMYSCSRDRVVKVWSLDELAFVSSLFGHEEAVVDIDALGQERCVSVGSRDRTARYWKVIDEKQLVFRGGAKDRKPVPGIDPRSQAQEGSIDRVAMIDDELFATGGDSGAITLWSIQKKNPLFAIPRAHGVDLSLQPEEVSAEKHPDAEKAVPPPQPRWITALKTIPYSDLILSGSWDGYIRVWKLSEDKRRLQAVGTLGGPLETALNRQSRVNGQASGTNDLESSFEGLSDRSKEPTPATVSKQEPETEPEPTQSTDATTAPPTPQAYELRGVVNDLSVFERGDRGKDGVCVVAAVGKEHKFGRWLRHPIPGAKNGGCVFEIPRIPQSEPSAPSWLSMNGIGKQRKAGPGDGED